MLDSIFMKLSLSYLMIFEINYERLTKAIAIICNLYYNYKNLNHINSTKTKDNNY